MKNLIKNVFRNFGIHISRVGNTDILLESFILKYKRQDSSFFFIQVGANNGIRYDPIYRIVNELKIAGIVIEPVKDYYRELVKNYSHLPQVKTANVAIYSENTELSIYRTKPNSNLPDWANGIASLDPNHHKKSQTPSDAIIEERVTAITFEKLIKDYNIEKVDFLQIDVEGYDYEILKMFPFEKFKPKLIHFEHALTSQNMSYEQYDEINSKLIRMGYRTIMTTNDTICYL